MTIREKALAFATKAHKGQKRKTGADYITHPIAVAEIALALMDEYGMWYLNEDTLYAVSLLHDVVEDTDVTLDEIRAEFGGDVAHSVKQLTKLEGENYLEAVLRAGRDEYSRVVKIADNTHNMSDLAEGSLKDKYRLSAYLLKEIL